MRINIIGGGSSIRGFDFTTLEGDIMAVNSAYKYVDAKYSVFFDNVDEFKKNANNPQYLKQFGGQWENSGSMLNLNPNCVANVNFSIFFAINVAIQLGYTELHMYGFDNEITDKVHFYDDDKFATWTVHYREKIFPRVDRILEAWKEDLEPYDLYFYNSAIKHFNNRELCSTTYIY